MLHQYLPQPNTQDPFPLNPTHKTPSLSTHSPSQGLLVLLQSLCLPIFLPKASSPQCIPQHHLSRLGPS